MNESNGFLSLKEAAVSYPRRFHTAQKFIFRDLSVDVGVGEVLVVLGPSGCGKTSLLNFIAGFLKGAADAECSGVKKFFRRLSSRAVATGHVFVDGKDISMIEPQARPVGMVMQR